MEGKGREERAGPLLPVREFIGWGDRRRMDGWLANQ
jgi:hypothetical protein